MIDHKCTCIWLNFFSIMWNYAVLDYLFDLIVVLFSQFFFLFFFFVFFVFFFCD